MNSQMNLKELPPAEIVALCEQINKDWLGLLDNVRDYRVKPSKNNEKWDIALFHRGFKDSKGEDLCLMDYIDPDGIGNGHVLYLVTRALDDRYVQGIREGQSQAMNSIVTIMSTQIFGSEKNSQKLWRKPPC